MAPKLTKAARTEKACRALRDLRFPVDMIRAKLEELLRVHRKNWKDIEDSNYSLLIDAILSAEEEKQPEKVPTAADPEAKQVKRSSKGTLSPPQGTSGHEARHVGSRYRKGEGKASSPSPLKRKRDHKAEASSDSDGDLLPGELDLEEVSGKRSCTRKKKVASSSSSKKVSGARRKDKILPGPCSGLDAESEDYKSPTVSKPTNQGSARDEDTKIRLYTRRKKAASLSSPQYHEKVKGSCQKTEVKVGAISRPDHREIVARGGWETQVKIVPNSGSDDDSEDAETPLIRRRTKRQRREDVADILPAWENETGLICYGNPLNLSPMDYALDMYLNDPRDMVMESPYTINNHLQDDIPLAFIPPAREIDHTPADEVKVLEYKFSGVTETAKEVADNPGDSMKLLEYTSPDAEITGAVQSSINDEALVSEDGLNFIDQKVVSVEDEGHCCIAEEYCVASSSIGEMRLSLVRGPSLPSTICVPNEVIKVMEDECKKSYKITDPSFSFLKLMNDFCNLVCLMDSTMIDAPTSSTFHPSDSNPSASSYKATVFCAPGNDAPDPCLIASFRFHNLIEVTPQVPKHIKLVGFGFLQSIKGIEFVGSKTNKMISKLLEGPKCSRSFIGQATQRKGYGYLDDISKGEEKMEISVLEGSRAKDLKRFNYIAQNMVLGEANIEVKLGVPSSKGCCYPECVGDCQTTNPPCKCGQLNGGEFAYTQSGLVKEQLLREWSSRKDTTFYGHYLSRPHMESNFIKECWYSCGCLKKCGNRIVQRGITRKLQVFWTPEGKGWGVQTLESLPKGAFVCEYVGAILTMSELHRQGSKGITDEKNAHIVLLDAGRYISEPVLKDYGKEALCLDASEYGNVARFINHRCGDANLVGIPVEVETASHQYYHLAFFTTREVDAMEELTRDYGIGFNDHRHTAKQFQCLCSSPFCRDSQKDLIVID
ncbi:unnamed protein product [Linum trigynum]|uniref:SET domain-containing protein n=1 Tax=Linum trigynum TaxID=586398 RepID=A0AAV2EFJ5_9ROSI